MRINRLFACIALLATASAMTCAEPSRSHNQHRNENSGNRRPVRDVVGEVEQNYRGHVVDVRPPAANEEMYRVRVLQEGGRVKTLRVPANRERERGRNR